MRPVIRFLGISDAGDLLLPLTVAFSLLALFSGSVRLTLPLGSNAIESFYRIRLEH